MCVFRDLLDGLRKRGFQLNDGYLGTGSRLLAWSKRGGYYLGKAHIPILDIVAQMLTYVRHWWKPAYRGREDQIEERKLHRILYRERFAVCGRKRNKG